MNILHRLMCGLIFRLLEMLTLQQSHGFNFFKLVMIVTRKNWPAKHQPSVRLDSIMKKSCPSKRLMSSSGIGAMKTLSNLSTLGLTGERVKIFFLCTQICNWSTIHTVMYGMLMSPSDQMRIASPWLVMQFWFPLLLLLLQPLLTLLSMMWALQNKQSTRHSAETKFANLTPRWLLKGSRSSFFHIIQILIPSWTSPRIPLTFWVTWYFTMVSSPPPSLAIKFPSNFPCLGRQHQECWPRCQQKSSFGWFGGICSELPPGTLIASWPQCWAVGSPWQ